MNHFIKFFFVAQVSAIEKSISNGIKVAEVQITTLIEMLMRQAIKLDSICTEGDALSRKNLQVLTFIQIIRINHFNVF